MASEHWNNVRVAQDTYDVCDEPILFSTEGLGPCIGVCIAWKGWAGILHSSDIALNEDDLVLPLINKAKAVIPASILLSIHPVVCGGDTSDEDGMSHDPEDFEKTVLESRARILHLLDEAGFGSPHVQWNTPGGRMCLVADLKNKVVCVENDGEKVASWPICTKTIKKPRTSRK